MPLRPKPGFCGPFQPVEAPEMSRPESFPPEPRPTADGRSPVGSSGRDVGSEEVELLAPLAALTNYERQRQGKPRWGLETMHALLDAGPRPKAWNGSTGCRVVQVGGSKGKGTVVHLLESMGCAAGLKTVALTSPHLCTVRERIRIDGAPIPPEHFQRAVQAVLARARAGGLGVSFFEATVAAGIQAAADVDADLVLLEVGLGGRLDATTAVDVDGVVLTTIELEHTAILGDTIPQIAGEKAGCIRAGVPVWTCARGAALEVFQARAMEQSAPLTAVAADQAEVTVTDDGWHPGGAPEHVPKDLWGLWGYREGRTAWQGNAPSIPWRAVGLPAAAVPGVGAAMAAWRDLVGDFPAALLADGALHFPPFPGRGEVLCRPDGSVLLLDGAHTPGSCRALAEDLGARIPGAGAAGAGGKPHLVVAFHPDKDWRACLRSLAVLVDKATVVPLAEGNGVATEDMAAELRALGVETRAAVDPMAVLDGGDRCYLVTGSFHLVGEVRRRWFGR